MAIDDFEIKKECIVDEFAEKHTARLKGVEADESHGC
jgi:hypothetical protein